MRYSFELLLAALNGTWSGEKLIVTVRPVRTDMEPFTGTLVGVTEDGRLVIKTETDYHTDIPAEWVTVADIISA